eukprot:scaffold13094_cov70-Phaeocystis_antarctica.AAC.6
MKPCSTHNSRVTRVPDGRGRTHKKPYPQPAARRPLVRGQATRFSIYLSIYRATGQVPGAWPSRRGGPLGRLRGVRPAGLPLAYAERHAQFLSRCDPRVKALHVTGHASLRLREVCAAEDGRRGTEPNERHGDEQHDEHICGRLGLRPARLRGPHELVRAGDSVQIGASRLELLLREASVPTWGATVRSTYSTPEAGTCTAYVP